MEALEQGKSPFSNVMISIDVGNTNLWQIKWNLSIDNVEPPIGRQICPFLIESPIVAIFVQNPLAKPTWYLGGWCGQAIATGITLGGFSDAEHLRRRVGLNRLQIVTFELDANYSLFFHPAPWHSSLRINAWEYVGEIN